MDKTKNYNRNLTKILIFSTIVFLIVLLEILLNQMIGKKQKTDNINYPTDQSIFQGQIPVRIIIKRNNESKLSIYIDNNTGKNIDLRAFTLEIILEQTLTNLTEKSIEKNKELENKGFIFPIINSEVKEGRTLFKLAGVLIGEKTSIESNQKINLVSINLDAYNKDEIIDKIRIGEETKIIDNSGNSLEFTVEKE